MPTLNKSARFPPQQTLRFIPANKDLPVGYNTWPFDQGFFWQHIREFYQTPVNYKQKVCSTDQITIYFDSLATSCDIYILDCKSKTVATLVSGLGYTHSAVDNLDSYFGNQYYTFIHQFKPADVPLAPGFYYVLVKTIYATDAEPEKDTMFVAECIHVRATHEDTMLFEYSNDENDYDILWEPSGTPKPWAFRIEADIEIDPAFHDTVFEDMLYKVRKLQSIPYRAAELMIGGEKGVAPWALDKISNILSCYYFKADGVEYEKEPGANWSIKKVESYKKKAGTIKLRYNPEKSPWEFNNSDDPGTFRYHDDYHDDYHD